jgi:DNA-binding MarR family transcriptional regulator
MDTKIIGFGKKAHNASRLIEFLYQKPIITITEVATKLDITKATASSLIKDFQKNDILDEITGFQRNKSYAFVRYLQAYRHS